MPDGLSVEDVNRIAAEFGAGPLLGAIYQPESWAVPTACFENVAEKVRTAGGGALYGWTFHARGVDVGNYAYVTHHAVWNAPDRLVIDVTPMHPDPRHRPLLAQGRVLFLFDENARLVVTRSGIPTSLPLRFFPLGSTPQLLDHVRRLNDAERDRFRRICDGD